MHREQRKMASFAAAPPKSPAFVSLITAPPSARTVLNQENKLPVLDYSP